MLNTLKKALKSLLGGNARSVTVTIETKESGKAKNSGQRREKTRDKNRAKERNKEQEKAREKAPKRERAAKEARPPRERKPAVRPEPAAAPKPEHPAELRDVPPCEGKTRFLDLPLHPEVQFGVQTRGLNTARRFRR